MEVSLQTMVMKKKVHKETAVKKVKPSLPRDLIESNILTRLPVKTLIRFTSACKSWNSLLSDPYFLNIHHQIQHNKITNRVLIEYFLGIGKNPKVVTHCFWPERSSSSFSQEKSSSFYNNSTISPSEILNVVGCCDGIVCVMGSSFNFDDHTMDRHFSLWNPALRISKIIASTNSPASHSMGIGLGYHNQTNDYNFIIITVNGLKINHVEIYSLNLDSWRKVDSGNSNQLTEDVSIVMDAVYVSCYPREGAYCWLAFKDNYELMFDGRNPRIISFDMEDEAFREMMLPYDCNDDQQYCHSTLFAYKDSVAVFYTCFDESTGFSSRSCYIWAMKDHRDPKSWTKLYNFDSQRDYVSFRGVIENDLIQLLCGDQPGGKHDMGERIIKEVKVIDVDKLWVKTTTCPKIINFLTKARWVGTLAQSLISLNKIKGAYKHYVFHKISGGVVNIAN